MVGRLLELGQGLPADPAGAAAAYRRAAARGYPPAQRQLGLLYLDGRGVARDPAQALGWLLTAAQADDAEAAYRAGLLRESGLTLGPDPVAAERLLGRAADQGHVPAQAALARLLAGGDAAERTQAALWLEIALRLSSPGPGRQALAQSRDALVAGLPSSEVARLHRLAAVWEPRRPMTGRAADGTPSPWL
jgi:TPR repeat protein